MSSGEFPLFILTLRGDEARRAALVGWLDRRGIGHELFFGVDGRGGLASEWEAQIDRAAAAVRLGRAMGDGEFACALSHQEIYRAVLERGLPGAVVLEDDAVPGDGLSGFLKDRGYLRAPIVLLDHSNTRVRGAPVELGRGVRGHPVALPPFRTTGYTISAQAARQMRHASLPLSFTADWPCDIAALGAVAAMPRLVGHPADEKESSRIERDRLARQRRAGRFLTAGYWRRWWRKRRAVRLPEGGP